MQQGTQPAKKEGISLVFVRYERTQRTRDTRGASLVRYHDEVAANSATATKTPLSYSHAPRKTRLHRRPVRTRQSRDSLSHARIPTLPADRKCCIRPCKSSSLARLFRRAGALSFSSGHLHTFESPLLLFALSCRRLAASRFLTSLDLVPHANDFVEPLVLLQRLQRNYLCALQRHTPRHIQPLHKALFRAFFYNALTQLCGHLLHICAVQIEFLGNLVIGEIETHEIETQNPHLERLVMARKDSASEILTWPGGSRGASMPSPLA